MWLLAGSSTAKALYLVNPTNGSITTTVPVSNQANSLAESTSNLLAVGLAGPTSGAVDLYDSSSGHELSAIPVGAPVHSLAFGANGSLDVLDGTPSSESVTILNTSTHQTTGNVSVPLHSVGLAADPALNAIFTANGSNVDQIPLTKGQASASFTTGDPGISLALSPDGQYLYVLKGSASVANTGVLKVATESMVTVMAAAANSEGIAISRDGSTLYDFVGTASVGNIQAISVPAGDR